MKRREKSLNDGKRKEICSYYKKEIQMNTKKSRIKTSKGRVDKKKEYNNKRIIIMNK